MLERFEFEELQSPDEFVRLCSDVLEAEGGENLRSYGKAADQGLDLLVDIHDRSPLGLRTTTYLVQCKWWSKERSVGQAALSEALTALDVHGAGGLLFLTSGRFSGTAVTKANAFNRQRRDARAAVLWDGHELSKRLWRNPSVADRYFGSRIEGRSSTSVTRRVSSVIPARYAPFTLQGFPERGRSRSIDADIDSAITQLKAGQISTVIIEGGIGAGKTGLAAGIARELGFTDEEVGFAASFHYLRALFAQYHVRDHNFLESLKILISAPCLIIDDFGEKLGTDSNSKQFAMDSLVRVIDARQAEGRPTLITVYQSGTFDRSVSDLIARLRIAGASIRLGHESLRGRPGLDVEQSSSSRREFLSRGWLLEKLGNTEGALRSALDICSTPNDLYAGHQKRLGDMYAVEPLSKEEELRFVLDSAIDQLRGWSEFVANFPFDAIEVKENGEVELRARRR